MSENPNVNRPEPSDLEKKASEAAVTEETAVEGTPAEQEPEASGTAQSTIFQKHIYEDKKPVKNGNKRRIITCVIAVALCAAIAGSAFLVRELIPNDEGTVSMNSSTVDFSIKLLDYNDIVKPAVIELNGEQVEVDNNIKGVSIYNYYENYSFAPYYEPAAEDEEDDDSSDSSSSEEKSYPYDTKWQVNGIDRSLTLSSSISSHIKSCLTVTAIREMENTFDNLEEYYAYYGLDDSTRGFTVEFTDGTEDLVIIVGDQLPSKDANYVTVSGDEKVYAVSSEFIKNYDYLPVDFADMTTVDAIEQNDSNKAYFNEAGDLARFDYITLSGRIFGDKPLRFEMSEGPSADFMPYMMMIPYRRPADETFIESVLSFANNGLDASRLYTFNATEENKKACALDDPACVIELKAGDYRFKLTVGGMVQEESTALSVMADGRPQIFSIDASFFDFVTDDYTEMFNQNFIMENIYTIKSVIFTDTEGSHEFSLTHTPIEGAEEAYNTAVKKGGAEMDDQSFKHLYQRVLMLSLLEFSTEEEPAEPILTVRFKYIGDYEDKVLEFTISPHDAYHCIAWVDGTPLGEVLKTSVDDIIKNLEVYNGGGTVPAIN